LELSICNGGGKISRLPKIKIIYPFGRSSEVICDLEEAEHRFSHGDEVLIGPEGQEQAKYRFIYGGDVMVMVEGSLVRPYEELVKMASQDEYRHREFLKIELLPMFVLGG